MTGAGSQRKGKAAERELAKLIEAQTGERCFRTPQSGAAKELSAGDLLGPVFNGGHTLPKQLWESKNHARSHFYEWWVQASENAESEGKTPVLAVRQPNAKWTATVPLEAWIEVCKQARALEIELKVLNAGKPSLLP